MRTFPFKLKKEVIQQKYTTNKIIKRFSVSYNSIQNEVQELTEKSSLTGLELINSNSSPKIMVSSEAIKQKLNSNSIKQVLYERGIEKINFLTKKFLTLKKTWFSVCSLYGEDPKQREPFALFSSVTEFVNLYKVTLVIICQTI